MNILLSHRTYPTNLTRNRVEDAFKALLAFTRRTYTVTKEDILIIDQFLTMNNLTVYEVMDRTAIVSVHRKRLNR